jgi:hypothetical protein
MKSYIRSFIFMFVLLFLGASVAKAKPVEFVTNGYSGMYEGIGFSGNILYDTTTFVNKSYNVWLDAWQGQNYYAGESTYVQSAPSASIFHLQSFSLPGFDIDKFNAATNFVNTITIKTDTHGLPSSSITFRSMSDDYWFEVRNLHFESAAFAYANSNQIYDLPTELTPFWPGSSDWSEYYYYFQQKDLEDQGKVDGVTSVPEPGSAVLLGAGLALVVAFAKRQGKNENI